MQSSAWREEAFHGDVYSERKGRKVNAKKVNTANMDITAKIRNQP
jgi:hypothetical protein